MANLYWSSYMLHGVPFTDEQPFLQGSRGYPVFQGSHRVHTAHCRCYECRGLKGSAQSCLARPAGANSCRTTQQLSDSLRRCRSATAVMVCTWHAGQTSCCALTAMQCSQQGRMSGPDHCARRRVKPVRSHTYTQVEKLASLS